MDIGVAVGGAFTVCADFSNSDVFARWWYGEVVVQVSCRKSLLSPSRDRCSGVAGREWLSGTST